ncbi:MAG: response regulator [Gemmatimonadota bacterium]
MSTDSASPPERVAPLEGEGRTVLVLDDDLHIRALIRKILELYDFRVLEAEDARSALHVVDGHPGPIHAVLCDLVLPGLGGREAANNLLAHRPEARILFMSGYSSAGSFRRELQDAGVPFLPKPFDVPELLEALTTLLAD